MLYKMYAKICQQPVVATSHYKLGGGWHLYTFSDSISVSRFGYKQSGRMSLERSCEFVQLQISSWAFEKYVYIIIKNAVNVIKKKWLSYNKGLSVDMSI